MKRIIMVFGILLLSIALVLANGNHQSEIEEGRKLVESELSCDKLNDEQLEAIGEYYMEQMHPGEQHEAMNNMMKQMTGEKNEELMHINMARMMYCTDNYMGYDGMMGSGGMMGMMPMMMNMMGGNMMSGQTPQTDMMRGIMGNRGYFGYWNLLNVLYIVLLVGLIILVYLGIIKLWKNTKNKGGKK